MIKKSIMVLLAAAVVLGGITPVLAQTTYATLAEYEALTGKTIDGFNQSPMLDVRVAAGDLPPVEVRLPEEPMVVEPLEEIGRYGGDQVFVGGGPNDFAAGDFLRLQTLLRLAPDYQTIVPNIAKGWDFSEGYKTLTIYLRKGMKWSDGAPFTADDFLFWYEDILLNDELTEVKPKTWMPGNELAKVEKINDYTVRFQFAAGHPLIIELMAVERGARAFRPKHYLKKYHITYNPNADALAQEEGFDHWWQCFNSHGNPGGSNSWNLGEESDPDLPTLDSHVLVSEDSYGNRYFERNSYYWKVDVAGNQLPYIDKQTRLLIENFEVRVMKVMAGEIHTHKWTNLSDLPVYKENEEEGNYRTLLLAYGRGNEFRYAFNLTHQDPVLREIFNDIRFRQAMSLAINREEINDLLFYGRATPRQATIHPSTSFYEPWMGEYFAEYDPEKANRLLDEMGLDKRDKDGYRLRPDAETLGIVIWLKTEDEGAQTTELVASHWEDVGVKVTVKAIDASLRTERGVANEFDVGGWPMDNSADMAMHGSPDHFQPNYAPCYASVPWWNWYETNGESGEEPPEEVKRLFEAIEEWQKAAIGTEEYLKLGREIATINLHNLYSIGTVGMPPQATIISKSLKNTPKEGVFAWDYRWWVIFQPDQWFFEG